MKMIKLCLYLVLLFILSITGSIDALNKAAKHGAETVNQENALEFGFDDHIIAEKELVDERTITSKTYDVGDGTRIAVISTKPIHYKDENGKWEDIKLKLEHNDDPVYKYRNLTNQLKTYFPESSEHAIKAEYEGSYIKWQTLYFTASDSTGAEKIVATKNVKSAVINDSIVLYKNIFPYIDEEFVVIPWGVEERVVIGKEFLEKLPRKALKAGIAVRVLFSDDISVFSSKGELGTYWRGKERLFGLKGKDTIFVVEKPVAFDAKKKRTECEFEWKFFDGELLLFVKLDKGWIEDTSRVFPIVIDPEIYLYSSTTGYTGYAAKICAGRDWLGNCDSWSYYVSYGSIWCGSFQSHDDEYRGFATWSTASIPDGSTINEVQVRLYSTYTHFEGGDWTYIDLYQMSNNPYWASATTIFNDAYDGTLYASLYCTSVGTYYSTSLGSTACSHLRSQLSSDWFAIGGKDRYAPTLLDEIDFAGSNFSSTYQPRLYVRYTNPYCSSYTSLTVETPCYGTVSGSITSGGWRTYQFSAKQGNTYRFSFCDGGGNAGFDTYLKLCNSSCDIIAENDDGCGYPLSRLDWTAPSDATTYISVQGYGSASGSYVMGYRIQPTIITPTTSWNTTSGSISSGGYRWYQFSADADMIYEFTFCAGGGSASWDTYLELYNASCGTRIAYDDDGCGYPNAYLSWLSPGAGTYYLKVRGYGSASGSYVLAYRKMSPYITVTIRTSMSGGTVVVDGVNYSSPYTVVWRIGTTHTIGVPSPQLESGGSRYVFSSWSDGGAQYHTVTATSSVTTYTANFIRQYRLTVYSAYDSPNPPNGEHWYNANTLVSASVNPIADEYGGSRYRCTGYTGTGSCPSGSGSSVSFNINSASTLTWNWVRQYRLIVQGNPSPHGSPTPPYGESWYDAGTNIIAVVGSPADESGGTRWRCTGYSGYGSVGSGTGTYVSFTLSSPTTLTWNWLAQYLLTMNTNWGTVSPGTGWYDQGTYVSIQAYPAPVVDGERGIWLGWSGSGSGSYSGLANPVGIIINGPIAETAAWDHQFRLIVYNDRPYGNPNPSAGEHWYTVGTNVFASIDTVANETATSRLRCRGFIGTGSVPPSGTNVHISFTINSPSTLRWLWTVQYTLVMNTNFGTVTPSTSWQDSATSIAISATPPSTITGERYLWVGWTGTGTGSYSGINNPANIIMLSPITQTATWTHQYRLLVSSEYGSPIPPVGENWFDAGTTVNGSVDTVFYSDSLTRHFCIGYTGTGGLTSGTSAHFSFVINQPSSVTWLWAHQYQFVLNNPSGLGYPSPPPGNYWYDHGTLVSGYIRRYHPTPDPNVRWRCTGYTGTGSLGSSSDTSFSFTITSATTLTWNWITQYTLTVSTSYGSPVPAVGTHWYDNGTEITARVDSAAGEAGGTRYRCSGFTGTGSVPARGDSFVVTFTITTPSTITWQWLLQYRFVVSGNPDNYGSPNPPYGVNWFDAGAEITANSNSPTAGVGGIRYRCIGFTGTGSTPSSGSSTSISFTIREPSSITWNWQTQYFLDMEATSGTYSPGDGWYDAGTSVRIAAIPPSASDGERYFWVGWTGTGTGSYTGTANPVDITMNSPITQTATWRHQLRLIVNADGHGNPVPPEGEHWYDENTNIFASNDSLIYITPTTRWGCTGWIGTGSVPARGDSTRFSFRISLPSSIYWRWGIQHRLDLSYSGTGGAVPVQTGSGWYERLSWVPIYSDPFVISGTETLYFAGWTTNPPGGRALNDYGNSTQAFIDTARTFIANYASAFTATILKSPRQSYGNIIIDDRVYPNTDSVSVRWAFGSVHSVSVTAADYEPEGLIRYVFDRWSDGGAITHNVGPVRSNIVLTAFYHPEYKCVVRKEPPQDIGWLIVDREFYNHRASVYQEFWWEAGSVHLLQVSTADSTTDIFYIFDHWSDGGDILHYTEPITGPTEFVAYYWGKYRFVVRKDPPERYGWIRVNETIYDSTAVVQMWADPFDVFDVSVSLVDVGRDTIYYMRGWNDGLLDTARRVGPLTEPVTLIATYSGYRYELSLCLNTNRWNIGRINCGERVTMSPSQVIVVSNCGNFSVDLGLQITAPGEAWQAGYYNGINTFVLRARFEEDECGTFRPAQDLVKMSHITWATESVFGPEGYNIPPCGWGDCDKKLWLQFIAPIQSTTYEPQIIRMTLTARPHIP